MTEQHSQRQTIDVASAANQRAARGRADRAILVVGPAWVGDMVMAQVLFKLLRAQHPQAAIDVLAPAWSLPLLARMPEIRRAIAMPLGHGSLQLGVRYRLGHELRAQHYDQAILLPNSFKSALIPYFARIQQRTGWRGEWRYGLLNDLRTLDKQRYPLMVQRFAALAFADQAPLPAVLPHPALTIDHSRQSQLQRQLTLGDDKPLLALCPGAEFGPAKRWPECHYASVAATMLARGWRVALFGSSNDRAVAQQIIDLVPAADRAAIVDLTGSTSLPDAIDLLATASAVVSNDSGLMHIAAATGRPLVVVYGSTSPAFTPPLAERVEVLQIPVDCGPCFQRQCPLGHLKCLVALTPERVIAALDRLAPQPLTVELH